MDSKRVTRLSDAEKLRTLATWFDNFDDWREATGKIAPGIAEYREVQEDLRRIAEALAAEPAASGETDADGYATASAGALVGAIAEGLHRAMCYGPATLHNRLACERPQVYLALAESVAAHPAVVAIRAESTASVETRYRAETLAAMDGLPPDKVEWWKAEILRHRESVS